MVGATGSGKSELLRSITAALAARHEPGLVNLLLVDFKGELRSLGSSPCRTWPGWSPTSPKNRT